MSSIPILSSEAFSEKLVLRKEAFRWVMLLPLYAIMFSREATSFDGPKGIIYEKAFGGFRWIDLFLILLIVASVALAWPKHAPWTVPKVLRKPAWLFVATIVFSIFYGLAHGGTNVFFDWRGIALGTGLVLVFGYWVNTPFALRSAVRLFLAVCAAKALWILLTYALGGGVDVVLLGVRTPFFDGPVLSLCGLATVMGFRFGLEETRMRRKIGYFLISLLTGFLVLICFRRTNWGEVFIAGAILIFPNMRARKLALAALLAAGIFVLLAVPEMFLERVESFDLLEGNQASDYADTNAGHIGDLLDAWDQIRAHPITGLGQGYSYDTVRIRDWKTESWMVHNAILQVWLRYGIVGLFAYLWFHLNLFGWIRRRGRDPGLDRWVRAFAQVSFAYMVALFITRLGFAPWPYGETQMCVVIAFMLGSLFALQNPSQTLTAREAY
jgi:O-Antigen ligase